jgi:hypothetical protein
MRLGCAQGLELEDLQPLLLARRLERVGPCAFLLGRAEDGCDLVLAREKRLEDGFSKVLLADDRDSHENAPPAGLRWRLMRRGRVAPEPKYCWPMIAIFITRPSSAAR